MKGKMIRMNEVEDKPAYELFPEGIHDFTIVEVRDGETKNGDPSINITLKAKDKKIFDNIVLSDNHDSPGWNVRWRAKMFLKAIGEPHHGDEFPWDSEKWAFKTLRGKVKHVKKGYGENPDLIVSKVVEYAPMESKTDDQDVPF